MSVQTKIGMFNKPKVDELQVAKDQVKKAKFLSKLSKFENLNISTATGVKEAVSRRKSEVQKKIEDIEVAGDKDLHDQKEREEEERKLSFEKIKGHFLVIETNANTPKQILPGKLEQLEDGEESNEDDHLDLGSEPEASDDMFSDSTSSSDHGSI